MFTEKFKFSFINLKVVVATWLLLMASNAGSQTSEAVNVVPESVPADKPAENSIIAKDIDAAVSSDVEKEDEAELEPHTITRRENPQNPCDRGLDAYDYEKKWYDETQIYINTKFCEPALWFDNFFGNDRLFEEGVAGTYVRWRNDFSYDEETYFDYKMDLNASVVLPGFDDKLRLTFEGEGDEDLRDVAPANPEDNTTNTLGLQVDVAENVRSKFSANLSLSPKLVIRYRYTYPVNERVTMRLTQEIQRKEAVHSGRTRFDYEHTVKKKMLFRSSTEGKVSEDYDGVDWLQAFILYQRINSRTSLAYETSASGITEPRSLVTNYRLGIRFRKNFHREWLFYEIVPQMTWPITLDENRSDIVIDRRSRYQLFFRLEVHFGNARKKRYDKFI